MRPNKRLTQVPGFTLIELLMAMVILGIVAIPMAHMIGGQIQGMLASTDLSAAGNLARSEMEYLNNLAVSNYANITTGSFSNYQGTSYDLTRTVVTNSGGSGMQLKNVTIAVNRHGSAKTLASVYSSIVSNTTYAP